MLVPDGSGALIYYNNNRLTANTYNKAVYGFDNGTNDMVFGSKAATAYFTVSEKPVSSRVRQQPGHRCFLGGDYPRIGPGEYQGQCGL